VNKKQNIPVMRDPTCAGCGEPVDYADREPVSDGRTLWHFQCYLVHPDPQRPTTNYTLVSGRPVMARGVGMPLEYNESEVRDRIVRNLTAPPATMDPARMIRWLEGKITGWEKLEARATANRIRKQYAWQLLHARAVLALLRSLGGGA